jgi:hypothetical protein
METSLHGRISFLNNPPIVTLTLHDGTDVDGPSLDRVIPRRNFFVNFFMYRKLRIMVTVCRWILLKDKYLSSISYCEHCGRGHTGRLNLTLLQ